MFVVIETRSKEIMSFEGRRVFTKEEAELLCKLFHTSYSENEHYVVAELMFVSEAS